MLEILQSSIKALQTDSGNIVTLMEAVKDSVEELRHEYIGDASWSGRKFSKWLGFTNALEEDEDAADCGWVMSKGPDVYGITHDEEVLCSKIQDDLVPLHAKHVATAQKPKPGARVQPVNFERAEPLINEMQTDMTAAVLSVVDDIEKRLPDRVLLTAFRIVRPAF
jgi:hypothetical protein